MTPAERAFWTRAQRRAAGQEPEIQAAILRAFQIIRDSLSDTELERIVASGNLDQLFAKVLTQSVLDRAFIPLRQRIRAAVERQVRYAAADLPRAGRINGEIAVMFDYLNPKVLEAVRTLDTAVIQTLSSDVRETVRAYVENGLRDGVTPQAVARSLRSVIGLAPNQELAVRNHRLALETAHQNLDALDYKLRDHRFDTAIRRARDSGIPIDAKKIDAMDVAYRKRFVAFNAQTNAHTAAMDSMKLGQRLSWESAADRGIVDRGRLTKTWVGVMDDRERPEHVAMEGETVGFDEPFSNGESIPGESTFNCRCIARYRQSLS